MPISQNQHWKLENDVNDWVKPQLTTLKLKKQPTLNPHDPK